MNLLILILQIDLKGRESYTSVIEDAAASNTPNLNKV